METLKMKFNYPFAAASERLKREALSRPDYDPTSLFRWGSMLGLGVLRMLQRAEKEWGAEGQRAMIEELVEVGREVGRQMVAGVEIPVGVEPIEFISAFASMINREVYASPEAPAIQNADRCSFDILWCPHQEQYQAFDCRVQRYLVQGMMEALREHFIGRGLDFVGAGLDFNVKVVQTIPAGGKVCTFQIWRKKPGEDNDWNLYSGVLEQKALEWAKK